MDREAINLGEIDSRRLTNLGLFLLIILFIIFLISFNLSRNQKISAPIDQLVSKPSPLEGIKIEAKSAIVFDLDTGTVLYDKNANETMPLASLTKVMTAVTALDLLPASATITVNQRFLAEEGDSGLRSEEDWELRDLIDLSLVVSSNDAAAAIAATAGGSVLSDPDLGLDREEFVKYMNRTAQNIGMENALFFNDTGLDIGTEKNGGYASARDYVSLLKYALEEHPEMLAATKYEKINFTSLNQINHHATNTNISLHEIPNIIASKTGFTEIAGGNLAIIFDPGPGRPIAIVVLGSSYNGRFADVAILTQKTLEAVNEGR